MAMKSWAMETLKLCLKELNLKGQFGCPFFISKFKNNEKILLSALLYEI